MYTDYKTFNDILAAKGMTSEQFEEETKNFRPGGKADYKIGLIAEVINRPGEGEKEWVANSRDISQYKYYPWHYWQKTTSGVGLSCDAYDYRRSGTTVAARLCYRDRARAIYAGQTFLAEYEEYYCEK
ncbi:MAG: hypothetical protein ACTHMV_13470 [Chitinophagaceae bacterium]